MEDYPNPFGTMFSSVLEIEIGVITAWSGGLGNIPPGWHLCDGTEGTPDLRDKFIPGSGASFFVGDVGGNITHDHDFTSNDHGHDIIAGGDLLQTPAVNDEYGDEQASGTTDPASSLPTFYSLAYIQFLGP